MSERLTDIEARIASVHQLGSVIAAMRGIAELRNAEARQHLKSVRKYAETVGTAIARAIDLSSSPMAVDPLKNRDTARHVIVALTAEQGFAGSFSHHILDHVGSARRNHAADEMHFLLVGDRGLLAASERGESFDWSAPMISSADRASALANQIMDAMYQRIDMGGDTRVTLIHASAETSSALNIEKKSLVPFDYGRFPAIANGKPPLLTLAPALLLERLVDEYIFSELCEAVILSFAAENQARMRTMISAQHNLADTLDTLVDTSRRLRQEEITTEINELSNSALFANR
jgi:F-type H+-transporting ATPase subunit gamma